jgi:hypothetical protein
MVHSKKTIYALLLAVAILCGCSQREEVDNGSPTDNSQSGTAYVQFQLQTNGAVSSTTRSPEDSYSYVQGTAEEYKVNNARVYLFDTATKLFVKSVQLTGLTRSGTDAKGNIIYETEHVAVPQGTYDIFVVANSDRPMNQENVDKFLTDINNTTYAQGAIEDISAGVVMANRASDNLATVIVNREDKKDNPIVITLERVLARLDIAKSAESFPLTDDNSRQYASVTLTGHYVVNLAKSFYTFRHTAVLNDLTEPEWNLYENFGMVNEVNGYVIDPYFFKKTISAVGFTNADKYYEHFFGDYRNPNAVKWTAFKPVGETPQYNTMYCLENCTLAQAQKNGYSTGVIFQAKFEPYNSVYHLAADGQTLELVTDKSKYPEVLYYFNYKFYDSPEALAVAVGLASVSGVDLDIYNARKFEKSDGGYFCYYVYWIRHYDNYKPTNMGVMEFAVVRNNLYRMLITNVSGLGSGEADFPVDPDIPDEGETFLKVVLNVKPWIVRDLTNIVL